jgi:hypothetical protein
VSTGKCLTIDSDLALKAKVGTGTFRVGDEHARTSESARVLADCLKLERSFNAKGRLHNVECRVSSYALTPADIELLWQTASTRMPIPPPLPSSGMPEGSQS